jgi:predicted enzyme related to lactoylglutathione lyase
MADRKTIPGKFVWFELETKDTAKAKGFYGELLGWKAQAFPMGQVTYDMILAGESLDTMIGGYAPPKRDGSAWVASVSVNDVDAAAKAALANGGKVLEAPADVPTVGRSARIADPQGAELHVFKSDRGDPPDGPVDPGRFFWNELHTSDPERAIAFYEKVVGFTHRSVEMPQSGAYHILSQGGVDRGGVTGHLRAGLRPHWLPYVLVDDPDATLARAKKLGATIEIGPADIPDTGRFGVIQDPTGAVLALMKPLPRTK